MITMNTPGPWVAEEDENKEDTILIAKPAYGYIAEIHREDGLTDLDWADAKLLAKAPDMLALLIETERAWSSFVITTGHDGREISGPKSSGVWIGKVRDMIDGLTERNAEKITKALAAEFSSRIKKALPHDTLVLVNACNKEQAWQQCATHDYCDSNEIMVASFQSLFTRGIIAGSADDNRIINNAWMLAKSKGFDDVACRE